MRATAGDVLGGRYRLTTRIAVGGMGEVWRARDDVLGRDVAVKLLKEEYTGHPGFLDRFRAEARHTAALSHPNIAAIYDYGEADGSAYLVMELVPGEALSDLLDREGPLPADRALRLLAQAAAGLAAAHAAGVVHRDVKPGNLLVTGDATVKVTDFGIARAADAAPLTATGQVMGTAQYLAPEQAMGRAATPASDVYALGVVTHEVLTGSRPFDGDVPVAVAMAHVNSDPPPLPETVPPGVRALVAACLAKDPAARPQDGAAFARAATSLAAGDMDHARGELPTPAPTTRVLAAPAPTVPQTPRTAAEPGPAPGPLPARSEAPPSSRRARRRLTGPLVALLALLGFVLVGPALAGNPFGDGQSPASPETAGPADTGTADQDDPGDPGEQPEPGTGTIEVQEAGYLGMDADAARDALERLGLEVEEVEDEQADAPGGTVVGVTEGTFQPGDSVTLVVADPAPGDGEDPGQQPGNGPPASPGEGGDTGTDGPGAGSPGAGNPGNGDRDDDGEDN